MRAKFLLLVPLLLVLFLMLFGCNAQPDSKTLQDFSKLKQDFGVQKAYSSDLEKMDEYITQLSVLSSKSCCSSSKVISAELSSANAFYYLAKAINSSAEIDYLRPGCNSKEINDAMNYSKLSQQSAEKAITQISALTVDELKNLRENQLNFIKGYKERAQQINDYLQRIC